MAAWQFLCLLMGLTATTTHRGVFSSLKAPKERVLDYEIVYPRITRIKPNSSQQLLVTLNSTECSFDLWLNLNQGLLSPKFYSRYHDKTGQENILGHENCFYHGKVSEEPRWSVVLSTCLGLRGSFGPNSDPTLRYHIEPLHHNLGSPDLTQPHVLYLGSEYSATSGTCGTVVHGCREVKVKISQKQKVRRQKHYAIVEWTLVNDHAQYLAFSSNLTLVVLRAIEIANGVDEIYKVEGVRIVVVDVVTWTMDDPIKITSDAQDLLSNFRDYSHNLPQRYDSAMLFTGGQFEGSTIGIAFTATMCEVRDSAVGVVQDGGGEMNQLISTTSHELGHIFSMGHDTEDCTCVGEQSNTCIMQDIIGYPPPKTWSSCSVETLRTSLAGDQGLCLNNEPATTVKDAACGNGIQEEGEACDCGSVDECTDPCCNTTSCQLVPGAECRAGLCCQNSCQFRKYGSVCRPERNECDIEEYCTGDHADCPTDSFLQNLTPCMKNKSYCFLGDCQTRDKQCQHHFGTNDGIDECYTEVNTQGTVYGHCGFDDTQYLPCIARNALCGQLQCADGGELKTTPGFPVTFTLNSPSFTCKSVTTDAGTDEISPGLIRDGTKCGEEMVCFRTKCVSVGSFDIPSCPVDNSGEVCSGNGQCNNQNQCSCFVGFTGQLCNQVAGGAKPTGQANKGAIAGAVIAVFVVLAIGGATTAVIVYFVLRSKTTFNLTNILRSLHSSNDQDFRAERHPSQPVSHHNSRANVSSAASSSKSETHRPTRPTAVSSTPGKVQASSANVSRHIAAFEQKSGASSDKPPQNCSKPPQRPPPLPARCKRPAAPERPAPPTSVSVLNPSKFSRAKQTPALKDVQRHGSTSKDT